MKKICILIVLCIMLFGCNIFVYDDNNDIIVSSIERAGEKEYKYALTIKREYSIFSSSVILLTNREFKVGDIITFERKELK